jgi:hypothetical protein
MNLTRNGKIARLPQTIREQLNQRVDDGEPYDSTDVGTQRLAAQQAESPLRGVQLDGSRPSSSAAPDQAQSN